jgi:hypothetical protein
MSETFQLFNLATMSGVFPGTRTMVYQRARLAPLVPADGAPATRWARILWYTTPPTCVVELEANAATGGAAEALVRILTPEAATLNCSAGGGAGGCGLAAGRVWPVYTLAATHRAQPR